MDWESKIEATAREEVVEGAVSSICEAVATVSEELATEGVLGVAVFSKMVGADD
jgi:hypothetical protein